MRQHDEVSAVCMSSTAAASGGSLPGYVAERGGNGVFLKAKPGNEIGEIGRRKIDLDFRA
jgi:hypothetical protein